MQSSYRSLQRWTHGQATGVRHVALAELFAVGDWRGRTRLIDIAEVYRDTLGLVSCSEARGQRWRRTFCGGGRLRSPEQEQWLQRVCPLMNVPTVVMRMVVSCSAADGEGGKLYHRQREALAERRSDSHH